MARVPHWFPKWAWPALALGLAYFLLAKSGLALASLHPSASPVWPPSGLALAALLLWGKSLWPAVTGAAFLANLTTFGGPFSSLVIALGNTLEAAVTASLVERWSSRDTPFDTPLRAAIFAALALAPGSIISATVGVSALLLAGHADPSHMPQIWTTWWLGDVGGQLLVTPVVMLWARTGLHSVTRRDLGRMGGLLFLTAGVGLLAFSPLIQQTAMRASLAFLAVVPLLWAALRHNQRDTATVALILCAFAIWGTLANGGPFAGPSLNDSFLLVMMFVISTAVPSLVLSADVAVRRTSEERYRALIDDANDVVATLDLDGRFTSVNPAVERILGYAPHEIVGSPLTRYVLGDQPALHRMLAPKPASEPATPYEMQLTAKDGRQLTLEVNSRLIFHDGRPVAIHAIARDITARKDAEAGQAVLIRELQHRTKNMIAVIQSITSNTLRRSRDLESAHEVLIGRLHALAHAQEFVAAGRGGGLPLYELVQVQLSPFAARAVITGEPLVVGGAFAQNFALIVHELATNAVKHGALSAPGGRVVIDWKIDRSSGPVLLKFSWIERGGPAAKPPDEQGLGMQLMALVGQSAITFNDEGLEYALTLPLEEALRGRDESSPVQPRERPQKKCAD